MNHKLTQLGTRLYLKADEVVEVQWVDSEPARTYSDAVPAHVSVVTQTGEGGFLGGGVQRHYHKSDWPFDAVRRALGLTDTRLP